MYQSIVAGCGHYVPKNIITNNDLRQWMDTTDEWIQERTGIKERRFITPGVDTVYNMSAKAALMALERAALPKEEIDFIVLASITPDFYFPGSGCLLQHELGLPAIGALDVRNQCSGFIYALAVADQFIKTGMYKTVLVVGAEIQSTAMDLSTEGRAVSVIFGDGAGAVVLKRSEQSDKGILSTHLHADGAYAEELICKAPGSSRPVRRLDQMTDFSEANPYMNGNAVFKLAVEKFPEAISEALEHNGYTVEDLDLVIPHQANLRISKYVEQKMGLNGKVFSNIQRYGNTTAASIPIAMSECWSAGLLKPESLVCLVAFGSGFAWGSALIRM
jgi:3-oxoacyl-[acyl-carrier-protein] synthase-3